MRLVTAAEDRARDALTERLEHENARLRAQLDGLLEHYHALKAQGAVTPLPKRESDGIAQVIAEVAGTNRQLRAHLGRFAREQKGIGTDDDEIINRLRSWDSDDDGVDE